MASSLKLTPLGRYLQDRPEVLASVTDTLAKGFVNSFETIADDARTHIRFESYINQNFPWLGIVVAASRCKAPLHLSFETLSSNSYRRKLAMGLAELGLPSVRSKLQQRQPPRARTSEPTQGAQVSQRFIKQVPELQPLASDHDGKFPKFVGQKVGQLLAAQYVEFLAKMGPSHGEISIYELLEDAEKDLRASAVRKYIPSHVWNTLAAHGGLGDYVFELRETALDVILHSLAELEGRRVQETAKALEHQSNTIRSSAGAAKSFSETAKPKPPPPLLHVNPFSFEQYCAEWSIYLGYRDAKVTRAVKDGGYDIASSRMIAQCKFQELPVGVRPIRELHGVATLQGKQALFFSLNGYSRDAVIEAGHFKMQLWTVHPLQGKLTRVALESEQMNEGDYHSGPDGYSPNTAYPETQYGSSFDEDAEWNK